MRSFDDAERVRTERVRKMTSHNFYAIFMAERDDILRRAPRFTKARFFAAHKGRTHLAIGAV